MKSNGFQVALLFIFGFVAIVGVLLFSGVIPGFHESGVGVAGTVTMWGTLPNDGKVVQYITDFNKANETTVQVVYKALPPETYEEDLIQALASGEGPDLFFLPDNMILSHRDKVFEIPFENYPLRDFKDTFAPAGEIYLSNKGLYGLPISINPLVMYYNRPLLASTGAATVPELWTDFVEVVKKIVRLDERQNISQSGTALGEFMNYRNAKDMLLALFLQAGVNVVQNTPDGYRANLNYANGADMPVLSAINFFIQFADPAKTTYTWNKSLPEARDAFVASTLATYFGFQSELPLILSKNPHLDFDIAMLPQMRSNTKVSYARVNGIAIAKNTPKKDAAFIALAKLSGADSALALSQMLGGSPARRDLLAKRQSDPNLDVFYRSALVSYGFLDPKPAAVYDIFKRLIIAAQSGWVGQSSLITQANGEIQFLIKK